MPGPETPPLRTPTGRFDYGTPDGYRFFMDLGAAANARKLFADDVPTWNDYMIHGTYDDYWQSRNVPKDLRRHHASRAHRRELVRRAGFPWAVPHVSEHRGEEPRATAARMVVGPWLHGGWARMDGDTLGYIAFGEKTGEYFRRNVELPFFNYYLKDEGQLALPEVAGVPHGCEPMGITRPLAAAGGAN